MDQFETYCQLLGVKPGTGAEEVRKKFRELIKKYHPDKSKNEVDKQRALLIIEAYAMFKNGVPSPPPASNSTEATPQDRAAAQAFWQKNVTVTKGYTYSEEHSHYVAERIFKRIFGDSKPHERVRNFFEEMIDNEIYSDDEDEHQWEVQFTPPQREKSSPYASNENFDFKYKNSPQNLFERAEITLSETVHSFELKNNRFQKNWASDFISHLTQIMVLYRDICRSAPAYTYKALQRIRQITELINEIKQVLK